MFRHYTLLRTMAGNRWEIVYIHLFLETQLFIRRKTKLAAISRLSIIILYLVFAKKIRPCYLTHSRFLVFLPIVFLLYWFAFKN